MFTEETFDPSFQAELQIYVEPLTIVRHFLKPYTIDETKNILSPMVYHHTTPYSKVFLPFLFFSFYFLFFKIRFNITC